MEPENADELLAIRMAGLGLVGAVKGGDAPAKEHEGASERPDTSLTL
jgi:hypothetical protein